jgi:cyanate lyase
MVNPKEILDGTNKYTLEDFYKEYKKEWSEVKKFDGKGSVFESLFLFIMLSAEEKSVDEMGEIYKLSGNKIKELQNLFKEDIELVRCIHMRKFLDLMIDYSASQSMTIRLLNFWIRDFVNKHILTRDEKS